MRTRRFPGFVVKRALPAVVVAIAGAAVAVQVGAPARADGVASSTTGTSSTTGPSGSPVVTVLAVTGLTSTADCSGVSGGSSNDLTLNGAVDPEGQASSWYFQYGSTAEMGETTPVQSIDAGDQSEDVAATLTDITGATIDYSLVAANAAGTATSNTETYNFPVVQCITGATGPPTTFAPSTTTSAEGTAIVVSPRLRAVRHGVEVALTCPAGDGICRGTVAIRTARAVRTSGSAEPRVLTLGTRTFSLDTDTPHTVTVTLSAGARTLLARDGRLSTRVVVLARDSDGGHWTISRPFLLRHATAG